MNNKKGQITLFVILGMVVLIIVLVAIFLINKSKEKIPADPFKEDYDAKLAPIYNDVVFCMNKLSKEQIQKIGATGGFADSAPESYSYNRYPSYNNNALELFPGSKVVIPYWAYISSGPECTECAYVQKYPKLTGQGDSIQNSIETYVEKNLISCLDNFSAYKFDLDISYKSLPVCAVELRDETVFVGVNWKLEVKFPDESVSSGLSKFSTTHDVKLKKMHEYARSIIFQMELIEDSRAFEYFTNDIISFYSFGGKDAEIPPVSGPTSFEFGAPKIWLQNNVEQILKDAVSETIPHMQVVGTKDSYVMFTDNAIKNNFYANFQNVVYYEDADFASQVRVRFNYYPIWPMYVSVGPSDGPVIMPESSNVNLFLLKLSTTRYKFYYDVTYPVLVTLEDDSAFGGEGFMLNFPFEVNLRDNGPYLAANETIRLSEFIEEEETSDLGYTQRTVPVKINVIDGYTNLPIEDVPISYTCLNTEYVVGTSEIKGNNPNAIVDSWLMPCFGGRFSVPIMSYAESPVYKDILLDTPVLMDYTVYPAKSINIELKKRLFVPTIDPEDKSGTIDRKWDLSGEGVSSTLETDEEVIVIMSEIKSDGSTGNTAFLNTAEENMVLNLVPGKYSVQVISTIKLGEGKSRMNLTIPARTIEVEDADDITINETVIQNTMYLGGLTMDAESPLGYFTITPENLASKSTLVIYYPSFDPDELKYIEDFDALAKVANATTSHTELFVPVFE